MKKFQNSIAVGGHRTGFRPKILMEILFSICISTMNLMQTGTGTASGMKANILMTLMVTEAGQIQRLR